MPGEFARDGQQRVTMHTLRHTAAMRLPMAGNAHAVEISGAGIPFVVIQLGHADLGISSA